MGRLSTGSKLFQLPKNYSSRQVLRALSLRAIPGLEEVTGGRYSRALLLPDGPAVMDAEFSGEAVRMSWNAGSLDDAIRGVSVLRQILSLEIDIDTASEHLLAVPGVSECIVKYPGLRIPQCADPLEAMLRGVVGQQVSLRAGLSNLARAVGLGSFSGGRLKPLPNGEHLALTLDKWFRGPQRRREALRSVLELDPSSDDFLQRAGLIPGIGPWTLGYVRLRGYGDLNADLSGDASLKKRAVSLLSSRGIDLVQVLNEAEPYRAYALVYLASAADINGVVGGGSS